MFEKIVQMSLLYDFYGQLLTKKQQQVLELYYNDDLSLGEISEQLGVSRQAVYDTIKRSEKLLFEYEEKLRLVHKFITTKKQIEKILNIVEDIESNKDLIKDMDHLLEELEKIKRISYDLLEK
ncbi:putative DNA-binding protein [Crassaminicella profunda]|uniref:putative DNA-binding protein n=1 Tax=Crassaminicella profunda TaxID=1286698 RepID=UPI001CA61104|nr:putative DNA-binding protein [Crassaminicella profunda]QZY57091.1 putative DNA-binding protein [Crassaminicella profunda]